MNEIKFRAWDDESRTMFYKSLYDVQWESITGETRTNSDMKLSNHVVMQCSQIQDILGNDLYENDIFFAKTRTLFTRKMS